MSVTKPTLLIVLDGLGISDEKKYNAFFQAETPHLTLWKTQYSYTTLHAAGNFVGLPIGYNGNSEVGHFTLGAGRITKQTSTILNTKMHPNHLYNNTTLSDLLKKFNQKKRVHILGLVSQGNVHSNLDHLKSLISTIVHHGITNILVHAFIDGRDTPPRSALKYLKKIQKHLDTLGCGKIATLHGRYYAMDRNENFDRTKKSFDVLTQQQKSYDSYQNCIEKSYANNVSDEFLIPVACIPNHTIEPDDGVVFFNFRPDRAVQITKMLLDYDTDFFITPIIYHKDLPTTPLVQAINADETLLQVLSKNKMTILTVAETEKYAHLTYFFNGHNDINFPTEERVLIPSSRIEEPFKDPTMQAKKITNTVLNSLQENPRDFYLINYANADMVGHSGNLDATISAVECLDTELGKLYEEVVIKQKGTIYITADHGNAEIMFSEKSGQPCTSHTDSQVPFYMISANEKQSLNLQSLADIAPFILKNMNINVPKIMTGTHIKP